MNMKYIDKISLVLILLISCNSGINRNSTAIVKDFTVNSIANNRSSFYYCGNYFQDKSINHPEYNSFIIESDITMSLDIRNNLNPILGNFNIHGSAVDSKGSLIICGIFKGILVHGETGDILAESTRDSWDVIIIKFNQNLEPIWHHQLGGDGTDNCLNILLDENDNTYVVGYLEQTTELLLDQSRISLTLRGFIDGFVIKFDESGDLKWLKNISGSGYDVIYDICKDNIGDIYISGYYEETEELFYNSNGLSPNNYGKTDAFYAKLDDQGNLIHFTDWGGNYNDICLGIYVNNDGNIYTTGSFRDSIEISQSHVGNELSSHGDEDAFIICYGPNGVMQWADSFGGSAIDQGYKIDSDDSGNLYITGKFSNNLYTLQGGAYEELFAEGIEDGFIVKLSENGAHSWTKRFGNLTGNSVGRQIICIEDQILIGGSLGNEPAILIYDQSGKLINTEIID